MNMGLTDCFFPYVLPAPTRSFAMLLVAVKLYELLNWWPDRGVPRRKQSGR